MHVLSSLPTKIFILTSVILAIIFISFPQIDVTVSGLFFEEGKRFYLSDHPIFWFLHKSVKYITISLATLWISLLFLIKYKKKKIFGLNAIRVGYLLLALIIGPGLVVNAILKDNWGRARPHHIEIFGGDKKFTPAFYMSNQCGKNCSFVAGDPSVGFYFFALALAITKYRRFFTFTAIGLGTIFSITRIVQGGHFFSDTIFSGIFTFATVYLLYILMLKIERKTSGNS